MSVVVHAAAVADELLLDAAPPVARGMRESILSVPRGDVPTRRIAAMQIGGTGLEKHITFTAMARRHGCVGRKILTEVPRTRRSRGSRTARRGSEASRGPLGGR